MRERGSGGMESWTEGGGAVVEASNHGTSLQDGRLTVADRSE
jgi:hypothetical protein